MCEQFSSPFTTQSYTISAAMQHRESSLRGTAEDTALTQGSTKASPPSSPLPRPVVPEEAVKLALRACEVYLSSREHEDIEGSQFQLVSVCVCVGVVVRGNGVVCNGDHKFPSFLSVQN